MKVKYIYPYCEKIQVKLYAGVLQDNFGINNSWSQSTRPEDSAAKNQNTFEEINTWDSDNRKLWDD